MILVIGGTRDALDIACALYNLTKKITISTATEYGFQVSRDRFPGDIIYGRMNREDLKKYIQEHQVHHIVDASHPYAQNISQNAMAVANELNIDYVRFERPEAEYDHDQNIIYCGSYRQAGELAEGLAGNIFVSIGINNLDQVLAQITDKRRVKVRVLPQGETLIKLEHMGLNADQIIAMKGPFSEEMNFLMLKESQTSVLICKDSGKQGGTDQKLAAAKRLGVKTIVINRPNLDYPNKFQNIFSLKRYFEEWGV